MGAARDGEVRGATWAEINLDAGVWTVPAGRMKAGRAHRVPLSPAAVKLLKSLPRIVGNAHLFPGASKLGRLRAVVHGMRRTFRNWGRVRTDFRPELLELALAHTIGNAVERANARDDGLEQRRTIMVA